MARESAPAGVPSSMTHYIIDVMQHIPEAEHCEPHMRGQSKPEVSHKPLSSPPAHRHTELQLINVTLSHTVSLGFLHLEKPKKSTQLASIPRLRGRESIHWKSQAMAILT